MKYILTIIFSLALVSQVYAFESELQYVATDESSNTGVLTTDINGILMQAPTANPPAGEYTGTQTITLSAPGSTSIHHFLNTDDFDSALTCSSGATTNPVTVDGSGLLRAIACYGSTAGPLSSVNYVISSASTPATTSGGGGGGGGGFTPTPTTTSTEPTDFNSDGNIDIFDFNILITNWGTTSGATTATGDADGNGAVDIFDFNLLIINWQS